jgi:hypothetical protein
MVYGSIFATFVPPLFSFNSFNNFFEYFLTVVGLLDVEGYPADVVVPVLPGVLNITF